MTWIRRLFGGNRIETDLSDEIRGHLHERIDELVSDGLSRDDAARQARREFGNVTLIEEQAREVWKWRGIEDVLSDVRFALRQLRKSPTFTMAAVLTLALGIGANTAIFSVVDGVLLQALPYPNPDRLVQLTETTSTFEHMGVAYPNFVDWKAQSHSFDGLAAFYDENYDLTGSGEPEHLHGKLVSASLFHVLGIRPVLGRGFDVGKDRLDAPPVIMISGGLWSRRFGSNPGVLGNPLVLNGRSYTIVGVVPAGFELEGKADVYLLLEQWDDPKARSRDSHALGAIGRLNPGVTRSQAESDMSMIAARLAAAFPKSNAKHGISIRPLKDVIVGNVGPRLLTLLGAVGFVLLIACANVANLLLARFTSRQQELAIRSALGAGRGRVVRQLLTENVVLTLAGGIIGLALAVWGMRAAMAAVPSGLPRLENIGVNGTVLAFTLSVSLLAGIGFGLLPARQLFAANLRDMLTKRGRGSSAHGRLRSLLIISEVAAALVLLVGAGLMVQTIWRLGRVNPGFDHSHVLTLSVGFSLANRSSGDRILQALQQTVDHIEGVPGVRRAAVSGLMPLSGGVNESPFYVDGRPRPTSQDEMSWALSYPISPGYFDAMAIPLLRGRGFDNQDMRRGSHVIVIDEVMARLLFPHEDPLGKRLMIGLNADLLGTELSRPLEIVGIAGHVNHWGLDRDATARVRSEVYIPFSEIPDAFMKASLAWNTFIVRTEGDPLAMVPAIRRAVLDAGHDQPVYDVRTMDQIVSASFNDRRFSALLLGSFAGLALLLAAVGIYGVISYTVAQRTREIGILVALGAGRKDVLKGVVARGMLPVLIGLAIGSMASLGLTRLMNGMLYGVTAGDPLTLVAVALVLASVALIATLVPAQRATRIAPVVALRCE